MSDTRGVFRLLDARSRIKKKIWTNSDEVFINEPAANTGYFAGGGVYPLFYSSITKITYSNDTTSPVPGANLSFSNSYISATGNSIAGYFSGYSKTDKLTYSTDTRTAVPSANLESGTAATGNSIAGYFSFFSIMNKITYSTDTSSTVPGANLSSNRDRLAATGNQVAGYFGGGSIFGSVSTMDKVTYSNDTSALLPTTTLSIDRKDLAATGNSTSGYFGGGIGPGTPGYYSTVDKITYSNDTRIPVTQLTNLRDARRGPAATGNSIAGYFGGGWFLSSIDKINYSIDTTASVPNASLFAAVYGAAASSLRANGLPSIPLPNLAKSRNFISGRSSFNSGYFGGGFGPGSPGVRSTMDKVIYSTDTTSPVPGANIFPARAYLAATGNSTDGYFGGGGVATMDKINYSTDTTTPVPGAALNGSRFYLAATGTQVAGYFGGGLQPSTPTAVDVATMDKVIYSTDTRTTVPSASLSGARSRLAATGNSTSGYFGGGSSPGLTIDRIEYSTDTRSTVPGASLSGARYDLAATGNQVAGYFGGGSQPSIPGPVATIDRIEYSTDTRTSTSLGFSRRQLAATGNSTAGYFGGGFTPGPTSLYHSAMDKVDYSTDTTTAISSASLSSGRSFLAASSSTANALPQQNITAAPVQANAGYFGGGFSPGAVTATMDKVTYSTGTIAAVPGASLSDARSNLAATTSSIAGYFGGGSPSLSANPARSTIDKLSYSVDTTAQVPGALLNPTSTQLAATGNSLAGYFGGGTNNGVVLFSSIQKLTYSTETSAPIAAVLSSNRCQLAATGNSTAGYFGGGTNSVLAFFSTMDKITYSTDTRTTVPGAFLSSNRAFLAATGNSTAGYFGGGSEPDLTVSSRMDKITYSTDTRTAVPGAIVQRSLLSATSNSRAGYFGGGSGPVATVEKLDYSTETITTSAPLSSPRDSFAATSSTANALSSSLQSFIV